VNCLNVIEDVLLRPNKLYEDMKHQPTWNNEQFLASMPAGFTAATCARRVQNASADACNGVSRKIR